MPMSGRSFLVAVAPGEATLRPHKPRIDALTA